LIPASALTLFTPGAALVVAGAFLGALLVLLVAARRVHALRSELRLGRGSRGRLAAEALLVALAGALLALAAAQPAVWRTRPSWKRQSVEALFAFDISRSMLAAASPRADDRLERARALALRLRSDLPDLPVGVVSFTDRALPLTPPDTDGALFADTVGSLIRIEEPPPQAPAPISTDLVAVLHQLSELGFFAHGTKRRLLVLFTDAESSTSLDAAFGASLARQGIRVLIVREWSARERVWDARGHPEVYRPDIRGLAETRRFAEATRGGLFGEADEHALASALRRLAAGTRRLAAGQTREPQPLGVYLVLAAALPLGVFGLLRTRR
jgi:hypothetical protein